MTTGRLASSPGSTQLFVVTREKREGEVTWGVTVVEYQIVIIVHGCIMYWPTLKIKLPQNLHQKCSVVPLPNMRFGEIEEDKCCMWTNRFVQPVPSLVSSPDGTEAVDTIIRTIYLYNNVS